MEYLNFIVLPTTGLIIGYFTNWVAIKMLFHPKKKFLGFQGVIPRRKEKIAESIAESALNFLPTSIEKLLKIPFVGKKLLNYIKKEISKKVKEMDEKELQRIIEQTAKKELKFIEFLGGFLGFLIGIIQAIILSII